eukprot:COSAG05_NODE_225_length_13597_cov_18.878723_11_plen_183_part_00
MYTTLDHAQAAPRIYSYFDSIFFSVLGLETASTSLCTTTSYRVVVLFAYGRISRSLVAPVHSVRSDSFAYQSFSANPNSLHVSKQKPGRNWSERKSFRPITCLNDILKVFDGCLYYIMARRTGTIVDPGLVRRERGGNTTAEMPTLQPHGGNTKCTEETCSRMHIHPRETEQRLPRWKNSHA